MQWLIFPSAEQFLLLLGFMFPPLLILILTVIMLASFGKSFGIREMYVSCLLRIFEWAAGEIRTAKNQGKLFITGEDDNEEEDIQTDDDDSFIASGYVSDCSLPSSETFPSFVRSDSGASSTDGKGLSRRTASAQSIIVRSTDVNRIDELENEIVSGRGRAVLDDSVYFLKAGIEAIVEDSVTCRFEAETLACICVANHTSPIDAMILSTDHCYALIGQRHPGLLGFIQRALSRATNHIWLQKHAENPNNLPVLIFPEGTCINNTSVMQFRKGSFETNQIVYPIAMKYDPRFGDAFWNSSSQGWCEYIMQMMSSWAIICHVWYLPSMQKLPNEDAIQFANRVKKTIAIRAGLTDLEWDGQLKRSRVPEKMVARTRDKYYKRLSRYTSTCEVVN
ncbi:hypothetical protein FO519_003078 [Halicephalobus sp. NKZ332]|nr:hypothetical protein FO519_003078 [Halicephalobus sp. NKZ332]